MNPLPFIPAFLILPVLFSCTQKSNLEIATGKVTTIKLGNVVRIKAPLPTWPERRRRP